jgi:Acyltransferase family
MIARTLLFVTCVIFPYFRLPAFILSLMVVVSISPGMVTSSIFGFYAVCRFFVVSGFVMTSGLHEVYRFDGKRFWINRLLRLLPPYYLVCLLTLLVVMQFPSEASAYLSSWTSDSPYLGALLNLLVIPLQYPEMEFRLVPPYWSIAVELQMYALLSHDVLVRHRGRRSRECKAGTGYLPHRPRARRDCLSDLSGAVARRVLDGTAAASCVPNAVDEMFLELRKHWSDEQVVEIVGVKHLR